MGQITLQPNNDIGVNLIFRTMYDNSRVFFQTVRYTPDDILYPKMVQFLHVSCNFWQDSILIYKSGHCHLLAEYDS